MERHNLCRQCNEEFPVTQATIDETRAANDYEDDLTDDEIANIIEYCPACAGVTP